MVHVYSTSVCSGYRDVCIRGIILEVEKKRQPRIIRSADADLFVFFQGVNVRGGEGRRK